MPNNETTVNPDDVEYFENLYRVSLNNYDPFSYLVYANHEQHALDQVANYLYEKDDMGYFVDEDDYEENEIMVIGCRGCHVLVEHTSIQIERG